MNKKKLLQSGFIYTLGNILIQGVAFITLPIYTRVISQETFGEYTLYFAWVSIFSIFVGLQTSGSLSSARVKYPNEYEEYAKSSLSVSSIFFICVLTITLLFRDIFSQLLGLNRNVLLMMVVQSYTTYVTLFLGTYYIQLQKSVKNLIITLLTTLTNVALSLTLIFMLENDYIARVVGGFVPNVLAAFVAIIYFARKKVPTLNSKYVKFMLVVSIPLIFHQLGYQLLNQQSRIMIANMLTKTDVAIFSFGFSMGMLIQIVLNSMNMAWIPWYFDVKKQGQAYQSILNGFVVIGAFLTFGYLTISPELARILGGVKYLQSLEFLHLIVIGYFIVFLSSIPINIQFYHGDTKFIPIATLITAFINLGLNYVMIPKFQIYGAALSVLISYIFLLVLHHLITKRKYNYDEYSFINYFKWIGLIILYSFVMQRFIHQLWIRWIIGLFVIFAFIFMYKQVVIQLLQKFKNRRNKKEV